MHAPRSTWQKDLEAADAAAAAGELRRACTRYESVARAAEGLREPALQRDVLVLNQPWFGFGMEELARALSGASLSACYADPDQPIAEAGAPALAEDWRRAHHQGLSLWEVARADFCVRHERSLEQAERFADTHPDAIAAEFARARAAIDRFARLFDTYRPRGVLVAQGHVLASAVVRALALRRGVEAVAIENTLHAERMLCDMRTALPVVESTARSDWLRYGPLGDPRTAMRHAQDYLERVKSLKTAQHATPEGRVPPRREAKKRIVYLGQVGTDASVIFGIGQGFTDQAAVIRTLAELAEAQGHELVVKLHPKEHGGDSPLGQPYEQLTWRRMNADPYLRGLLVSDEIHVDAENALDTYALIESADLCVTINSQAGLEALLMGKELVCCGRAFYSAAERNHEADDPHSLGVCVERVLDHGTRRNQDERVACFFHTYLTRTCCEKTPLAIAARLAGLLDDAPTRRPAAEPAEDATEYDSGERQTALRYEEIRADHRARYEFAAEALVSVGTGAAAEGIDLFCGNGYGTQHLAERTGARLVGIDGCEEAIDVARERYAGTHIDYEALHFPFALPSARFDFATCFESIEHVDDAPKLLAMIAGSLRPGGLLFLSTPNEAALPLRENAAFFGFHHRHFEREELLELAAEHGLALRLELGQDVYRSRGRRAMGILPEEEMALREQIDDPDFLIHVFERLVDLPAPDGPGRAMRVESSEACLAAAPAGSAHTICVVDGFAELSFGEGEIALAAWRETLLPGGKLDLRVPDLRFHARRLLDEDGGVETRRAATAEALAALFGPASGNRAHRSGYDFATLRAALQRQGFGDVIRLTDGEGCLRVIAWTPAEA